MSSPRAVQSGGARGALASLQSLPALRPLKLPVSRHRSGGATTPKPAASPSTPSHTSTTGHTQRTRQVEVVPTPFKALPGTATAASQAASPFGASLKLKFVSQDELKTVEYEFNQMSAVQRTYSPKVISVFCCRESIKASIFLKSTARIRFSINLQSRLIHPGFHWHRIYWSHMSLSIMAILRTGWSEARRVFL